MDNQWGQTQPIDPWSDTNTNVEVPTNILPPELPDQCEENYKKALKDCDSSCSNFATKLACRQRASIELWMCRGGDHPSGSDGSSSGGSDPGYTGLF